MSAAARISMLSGGEGSWMGSKRVVQQHGTAGFRMLFADTLLEDTDLYRFLVEGACNVMGLPAPADLVAAASALPEFYEDEAARAAGLASLREACAERLPDLVWLAEGRDPWTVFFDERFLGNSHMDPCSKILKRQIIDRWFDAHCDPSSTTVYVGIDWSEKHRYDRLRARHAERGWQYEAPLCRPPYLTKVDVACAVRAAGIRRARLYTLGLSHNNCGGGCVKAGQAHWARLYHNLPVAYRWWEGKEQAIRAHLGKPVSILTDRSGDGVKKPLTLEEFRFRLQRNDQVDMFDEGGCGCFSGEAVS